MRPVPTDVRYFRSRLLRWFKKNARDFPWRRTADPWKVLIAEMMLQRTRASQVEVVYRDFFSRFKKPSDLLQAKPSVMRRTLLPLGLRWRIGNFRLLSKHLLNRFNGRVPETREELLSLPGVGQYVAGAVLSVAFRQREWIVDSNVVRVFKRFFGVSTRTEPRRDKKIIQLAKAYSYSRVPRQATLALLDFAFLICVPRMPKCTVCPVKGRCDFFHKDSPRVMRP